MRSAHRKNSRRFPAWSGWSAIRTKRRFPDMVAGGRRITAAFTAAMCFASQVFWPRPRSTPSPIVRGPNLKIQDGCNNRCSFCVIPSVRGKSRFVSAERMVGTGRGTEPAIPRSGADRNQLRAMGTRAAAAACGLPICCAIAGSNADRAHSAEQRRADGLVGRSAGTDGRRTPNRPARAHSSAIRLRRVSAAHAPQVPPPPLSRIAC